MRRFEFRKFIWSSLLVLGLSTVGAVSPSYAQQDPTYPGDAQMQTENQDDGTDWGWLGLLGLAGLLGLRRRDRDEVHRVDNTTTRARP